MVQTYTQAISERAKDPALDYFIAKEKEYAEKRISLTRPEEITSLGIETILELERGALEQLVEDRHLMHAHFVRRRKESLDSIYRNHSNGNPTFWNGEIEFPRILVNAYATLGLETERRRNFLAGLLSTSFIGGRNLALTHTNFLEVPLKIDDKTYAVEANQAYIEDREAYDFAFRRHRKTMESLINNRTEDQESRKDNSQKETMPLGFAEYFHTYGNMLPSNFCSFFSPKGNLESIPQPLLVITDKSAGGGLSMDLRVTIANTFYGMNLPSLNADYELLKFGIDGIGLKSKKYSGNKALAEGEKPLQE